MSTTYKNDVNYPGNMHDFLPTDYEVPASDSNYFKFKPGPNTFRVLGSAIIGYEYWTKDKKPVRSRDPFDYTPDDARLENGVFKPKHFWAFTVWNYALGKPQIMEITQKSIMSAIKALTSNPKWGSPLHYDITVTKEGEGLDTEYSVVPEPPSLGPVADISRIKLEALYDGGDPFAS